MTDSTGKPLTIGMVAGEASGDNLGAPLIREILNLEPGSRFTGIGGPAMISEGFDSLADMERLSVNGLVDPLLRLPELLRLLREVRDAMVSARVDCFVGIDFNFFNLLLEGMLKKRGIRTVHYVSPSVWAWRQGRINKIRRNTDLMMCLYPFETGIYEQHGIPVAFVGHPKALEIEPDAGYRAQAAARDRLGIAAGETVLAVLPGSRSREVELTGRDFLETLARLDDEVDRVVIPAANPGRRTQVETLLGDYPAVASRTMVLDGESRLAMTAADCVLVNSGTATLEAMLLRRPMVMSYRLGKLSYGIMSRMSKTPWYALPNILAQRQLVPEFIQDDADPDAMADAVRALLEEAVREKHQEETSDLLANFSKIHETLRASDRPGMEAARRVVNACRT